MFCCDGSLKDLAVPKALAAMLSCKLLSTIAALKSICTSHDVMEIARHARTSELQLPGSWIYANFLSFQIFKYILKNRLKYRDKERVFQFPWLKTLLGQSNSDLPSLTPHHHRVYRVSGFFFPVVRTPSPSPAGIVVPPPLWVQGGRHTRLRGNGWGDPILPILNERTDTPVLYGPSLSTLLSPAHVKMFNDDVYIFLFHEYLFYFKHKNSFVC